MLEGFDGDTPRLRAPASRATVKQLVTHTTGLGYWFFERGAAKRGRPSPAPRTCCPATNVIFTAPLLADPGTTFVYGINTDWLGKVIEAAGGVGLDVAIKDGITGPLGMDETEFRIGAGVEGGGTTPVHIKGDDGVWKAKRRAQPGARSTTRAGTGCTPPRGLHPVRAGAAGRRRAGRRAHPERRTRWTPRSPTRSASSTSRRHIPTADPRLHPRVQRRAGLEVGLRAAAEHRGPAGHAARRQRRVGRAVQHALLGRPHQRHRGVDLLQLPAVRARRRRCSSTTTTSRRSTPLGELIAGRADSARRSLNVIPQAPAHSSGPGRTLQTCGTTSTAAATAAEVAR